MKILGIGSAYHDLNYCVMQDGKILVHNELERFSRIKQDNSHQRLYELIRNQNDWEFDHLVCSLHFQYNDFTGPDFVQDVPNKNFIGHHTCHASNVYYNSNFNDALVFTFDGGGFELYSNWTTSCIYLANKNKIDLLYKNTNFNIGGVWHMFLKILGLDIGGGDTSNKGDESGTLMAMSAYGDYKKYLDMFEDIFISHPKYNWFSYDDILSEKTIKFKTIADKSEQDRFDLAASLQYCTEQFMKNYVFTHINSFNTKNICFSGGVSLNCVSLGKIAKSLIERGYNVFCDQAPNDGGLSLGAVKYFHYHLLGNPRLIEPHHSYLGRGYSVLEIKKSLENYENINIEYDITLNKIVDLLMGGNIISLFNSGSESGKRALGNRSIIADPRFTFMKDQINEKVKHRKSFRPFAPSVLREEVSNWFEFEIDSPYMSYALEVNPEKRSLIPAILHKDNTARLQTVTKENNGFYYDLIRLFFEKTNVPMLLNTSFNDREPIVETPTDAINCFLKTKIDFLYFAEPKILVSKK